MFEVKALRDYLDARLQKMEVRLLKWQFGIAFVLAAIMAKAFKRRWGQNERHCI